MRRVRVKPSKGQSSVGFFVGLIFCGIGLFVVTPNFGAFGLFWTLIAVVITIINGANAFTDKGIATHEISIEDEVYHEEPNNYKFHKSTEDRLNELQSLYDKGMITSSEFHEKRKQILEDL
jgi:hypothetical protein